MPIKDLKGTPRDWRHEHYVLDLLRRLAPQMDWWPRFRDGGDSEPIGLPTPPKPKPLAGGATADD